MRKLIAYLIVTLSLVGAFSASRAEVHLAQDTLTVNVHNATMKNVLDDIRYQGYFTIVAFEDTQIGNVRISKKFWHLPLEAGLARLLSGWNYGINRNLSTGKISTLYLVSQRTDGSSVSIPLPLSTTQQSTPNANAPQSELTPLGKTHDDSDFIETKEDEEDEDYDGFLNE